MTSKDFQHPPIFHTEETLEPSSRSNGGVGRNVAEDIANVELEPIFIGAVDDDSIGEDVIQKLNRHKVDTRYMKKVKNGMGTWLAVFDHKGDVVASVSKRPDHKPMSEILDEHGDEIFQKCRQHCH